MKRNVVLPRGLFAVALLALVAAWLLCFVSPQGLPPAPVAPPPPAVVPPAPRLAPPPRVVPASRTSAALRLAHRVLPDLAPGERAFPKDFPPASNCTARATAAFVLRLEGVASRAARARVAACGARVVAPFGARALLVEADRAALDRLASVAAFRAADFFAPADKISPALARALAAQDAAAGDVLVTLVPLADADRAAVVAAVQERGGRIVQWASQGRAVVRAHVPAAAVASFAARGDVRWLEPFSFPHLVNDVAARANGVDLERARSVHGLTGKGQYVAIADSGVDSGFVDDELHPDLRRRVCRIAQFGIVYTEDDGTVCSATHVEDYCGHGTHVAGSIVGDGTSTNGLVTGMAPGATLFAGCVSSDQDPAGSSLFVCDFDTLFTKYRDRYPYCIHSDSWSMSSYEYDEWAIDLDAFTWRHPEFLPVFAAGNDGPWEETVNSPALAKNCLAVGAVQNDRPEYKTQTTRRRAGYPNAICTFSSRGPAPDGRIKPDVVAPGSWVLSTRSRLAADSQYSAIAPNADYGFMSGTSMATPLVAGCAALVREWLVDRRGFTNAPPSAALLRAILAGGARDLVGLPSATSKTAAPACDQGWGRVDVDETLYPSNRAVYLADRIPFRQGHVWRTTLVLTNAAPLDVQLAWTDAPGASGAAVALVNDLDLEVVGPDGVRHYGNGGTEPDVVDVMESVRLASAAPGVYDITVFSASVAYYSEEGGAAALYARGAFDPASAVVDESDEALFLRRAYALSTGDLVDSLASWHATGEVVHVDVPLSSPLGVDAWTNAAGVAYRLGKVEVLDAAGNDVVKTEKGKMAASFDWRLSASETDCFFVYYPATNLLAGTEIPYWWYSVYLQKTADYLGLTNEETAAADFDGDGRTNLEEWRHGTDPLDRESVIPKFGTVLVVR